MPDTDRLEALWQPRMLSILRIMTGLLYFEHGTSKLFAFPHATVAHLSLLEGTAGVLETFLGALIVVGLLTRIAAFLLSGEMAIGYFMFHNPHGFFPLFNHGEPAVLFCFLFLYFFVAGPGVWSLDAWRAGAGAPRRLTA
jgi:putative oxidoreductase